MINNIQRKFQFLMVRLIALLCPCRTGTMTVSIPYGAINRSLVALLTNPFVVSIPYGAINRRRKQTSCRRHTVSIPYGAINRMSPAAAKAIPTMFQFLMVRLIDYVGNDFNCPVTRFNSLWCD